MTTQPNLDAIRETYNLLRAEDQAGKIFSKGYWVNKESPTNNDGFCLCLEGALQAVLVGHGNFGARYVSVLQETPEYRFLLDHLSRYKRGTYQVNKLFGFNDQNSNKTVLNFLRSAIAYLRKH